MTETKSIRQLVMDDLVTTLNNIKTAKGALINVESVYTIKVNPRQLKAYPGIIVIPDKEILDQNTYPLFCTCRLSLALECWLKEQDDIVSEGNKFLAEVQKAIEADNTRGGNAIDTALTGVDYYYFKETAPLGCLIITVEISYRYRYSNPYTKT
jgi:hypothetical protein